MPVLFCSLHFFSFFLPVFIVYWSIRWHAFRTGLLLIASFVFYASWNQWLAILVAASTTVDYFLARGIESCQSRWRKRLLLALNIAFNLGILCYFKYANFFLRSLEEVLAAAGASASFPILSVILPLGISFYTFEAISYCVDVYRGKIAAERNLAHFMLFILFFPHLIAGPIVRGGDFLPQVRKFKRWNWQRMHVGLQLFVLGMVKKLAIGDRMATLVDPVFADPGAFESWVLWFAAVAYAVQVYCDFSGYTDMALGTAHMLGFRLAPNFNLPFLAPNISEFWRRWHISLSSWLRDYVFIPLGGSRNSIWRTALNLLVVMALAGLWHGAGWSYVLFGLIHGAWLCLHRAFRSFAESRAWLHEPLQTSAGTAFRIAATFVVFCLTLVVFRSPTLHGAGLMLSRMFEFRASGKGEPVNLVCMAFLFSLVIAGHWLAKTGAWRTLIQAVPAPLLGIFYAIVMNFALVLTPDSAKAFIYFQF